ncbi:hypothetical protein MLD38_037481 [Melastoma candidum]|uniref:Uncharacterized protein n=1 Tax=Melastoma candidum TaxID=119954 RepID=A0ACB9LPK3_9MYRT|nr:hypothetical protein MLD38_037481 [Melastoma candidum]
MLRSVSINSFRFSQYDLNCSKEERDSARLRNRQEYEDLRKECQKLLRLCEKNSNPKEDRGDNSMEGSNDFSQGQACYEVLWSSNTLGNDNWSKDSVLQCANTGPAAVADIPGDHKLDTAVNNTGEHLQENVNQDFLREDMMVERNMEKSENQAYQPVSTESSTAWIVGILSAQNRSLSEMPWIWSSLTS